MNTVIYDIRGGIGGGGGGGDETTGGCGSESSEDSNYDKNIASHILIWCDCVCVFSLFVLKL